MAGRSNQSESPRAPAEAAIPCFRPAPSLRAPPAQNASGGARFCPCGRRRLPRLGDMECAATGAEFNILLATDSYKVGTVSRAGERGSPLRTPDPPVRAVRGTPSQAGPLPSRPGLGDPAGRQ